MRTIFGVRVSAGIPPQEEKGPRERARRRGPRQRFPGADRRRPSGQTMPPRFLSAPSLDQETGP